MFANHVANQTTVNNRVYKIFNITQINKVLPTFFLMSFAPLEFISMRLNTIPAFFSGGITMIGLVTAMLLVLPGPYGLSSYTHGCGLRHSHHLAMGN